MQLKRVLILMIFVVQLFQSCDPGYSAEIINQTKEKISVEFNYDEKIIKQNIQRKISFSPEVIDNNHNKKSLFKIDTTRFVVQTLILPNDTLHLEYGIGTTPEFKSLKTIKIYFSDTIVLKNKENMLQAFNKSKNNQYELIVK